MNTASKKLLIIGAGGHGKVIADIGRLNGYEEIAFLDDGGTSDACMGYPVIGTTSDAVKKREYEFFVAIGNPAVRECIQNRLTELCLQLTTLIHPSAVIASDVAVGMGTVVMAGAVINPGSRIGNGCIINTGATVDHDNVIEDYVHISVGSHLAGTVTVGKGTWIGIGAAVSNNVRICGGCTIGAGAVVVQDIEEQGTYLGVPAMRKKKINAAGE